MSEKNEIVKEYARGESLTILWKPKTCIHAGICVNTLPGVYRPGEKPWIRPEKASVKALKEQIDRCPSGALAYRDETKGSTESETARVSARILPGGPLLVSGPLVLENGEASEVLEGNTAFCRCGASRRKPFCDGSHTGTGFETT